MYSLRDYQQESVNAVYEFLRTRPTENPCVVLPTGAGKSLIIAKIVTDAVSLWGGRVAILAHVKELLEQNAAKIMALCPGVQIGVYSAGLGRRDTDTQVVVAGIQSIYNRAADFGKFDLVLIDEAHLIPPDGEGMYQTFLNAEKQINPNVRLIGFTATPFRLRGGLICKPENLLNAVCYEAGVRELIVRGYLSALRGKNGVTRPDLTGLHIRSGEFIAEEVAATMDNDRLVATACSEIVELTKDRKSVLIFASSVEHAKHVKTEIENHGVECGIVTGATPRDERAEVLNRFKGILTENLFGETKSRFKYLVNVGVLTTGFDAPCIDTVVLLRPTASPGLYYQMVGRGFRLSPETGKNDCLVLDYGGNIMRHGPVDCIQVTDPDDTSSHGPPPMRECPQCHAVFPAGYMRCPDCGFEMPRKEAEVKHDSTASDEGILSGETSEKEFAVSDVYYSKHFKKASPDSPPTLRVEYAIGFSDYISDWICPEHSGYARLKSEKWWRDRAGFELPATVDECLELAKSGVLKEPSSITVRKVPGSDWPKITKYELQDAKKQVDPDTTPEEKTALETAEKNMNEIRKEVENMNGIDMNLPIAEILEKIETRDAIKKSMEMAEEEIPF